MEDFAKEIDFECEGDRIRFSIGDASTAWMGLDDSFLTRIAADEINPVCPKKHIAHEIAIKNILDEGIAFLKNKRFPKAIRRFDEVLFYDSCHVDALAGKSRALRGQKHYVKALRYYRKAAKCGFADVEYQKELIRLANAERDSFPKLKLNIYAGDEHFAKGEFELAVESYDRALMDPSKFKDRILSKLLNKKAAALVKLNNFEEALICFKGSLEVEPNDFAYYGEGCCEHQLGVDLNGKFRDILMIDKNQMINQATILNEMGLYAESLEVMDVLFENHFRPDDFYFRMLGVKKEALKGSDLDCRSVDEIYEKLVKSVS